jgi:S-adenosylmethionine:tRNA ribosyltransferase-isomerase
LRAEELDYELPTQLIAQRPAERRELARLMHVLPKDGLEHRRMAELPVLFPEGALVVVNDTRVVPARLLGRKLETGGRAEVFLIRRLEGRELEVAVAARKGQKFGSVWKALGKSSKPMRPGTELEIPARSQKESQEEPKRPCVLVRVLGRDEEGLLEVALRSSDGSLLEDALRACGRVPLPPYIRRNDDAEDVARYQTVYARHDGALAAPTAGLHLTEPMLAQFQARGCEIVAITLHVGLGTFRPVAADDLSSHTMHAEPYSVSEAAAEAIARAHAAGRPVVAVGTTTVRALESAACAPGQVTAGSGETRLLIQPGYAWRIVDGLLTNFHLPRSTLLALVCAFAGTDRVLAAYRTAVAEGYRFYSYGDGMLLWRAR